MTTCKGVNVDPSVSSTNTKVPFSASLIVLAQPPTKPSFPMYYWAFLTTCSSLKSSPIKKLGIGFLKNLSSTCYFGL